MINKKFKSGELRLTEFYFAENGKLLERLGDGRFHSQDNNTNVILVHLEDGVAKNEVNLINFTPLRARRTYTTHNFYLNPSGITERVISGEKEPRTFNTYYIVVPNLVLYNNDIENVPNGSRNEIVNQLTITKRYGVENLGLFNSLDELNGKHSPNKELYDSNAVAYVLDKGNSAFYQVELSISTNKYEWHKVDGTIRFNGKTKQYEQVNINIQEGYRSTLDLPDIDVSTYQMIMQIISEMQHDLNNLDGVIGGIETIDTYSIDSTARKVGKDVFLETHLKVDEDLNDLLKVGKQGVYVKHDVTKLDYDKFKDFEGKHNEEIASLRAKDNQLDRKDRELEENIEINKKELEKTNKEVTSIRQGLNINLLETQGLKNEVQGVKSDINRNKRNIDELNDKKMDKSWIGMNFAGDLVNTDELLINRGGAALRITAERLIDYLVGQEFELIKVVSRLPEGDISSNTIYLVPSDNPDEKNIYVEYVYADGAWEKLGEFQTSVSLDNYFTKDETYSRTQVEELLKFKANIDQLPTKLSDLENDKGFVNDADLNTLKNDLNSVISDLDNKKVDKVVFNEKVNETDNKIEVINYTLEEKADREYVEEQINNIPEVDLSNIYTKDETYDSNTIDQKLLGKENSISQFVKDVRFSRANNEFVFDFKVGDSLVVRLPEASLVKDIQLVDNELVFTFEDGSVQKIPLGDLLVGMASEEWVNFRLNLYAEIDYVDKQIASIPKPDLSVFYKKSETYSADEVDDKLYWKQDKLLSGQNIKTVNGYSLIGSGNIDTTEELVNYYTIDEVDNEFAAWSNNMAQSLTQTTEFLLSRIEPKADKEYVDQQIGDIGKILDEINGV